MRAKDPRLYIVNLSCRKCKKKKEKNRTDRRRKTVCFAWETVHSTMKAYWVVLMKVSPAMSRVEGNAG